MACQAVGPKVVALMTDDKLELAADLYLSGKSGGPAAILLHMVPPQNTRSNYPRAFIDELVKRGLTVLNVDRRGAGVSDGKPVDAYLGPKGKLDAKAARDFLSRHACPIDTKRLVLIGASNGTTTVLDYTVYASGQTPPELPRGLVFLTGGDYTEAQNTMAAQRTLLEKIPLLFVYSTAEKAWSATFAAGKPAPWEFKEYAGGDHGTLMFTAKPQSIIDVAEFAARTVTP